MVTIGLRRSVIVVAVANLFYFFVEFSVAQQINSVSLYADSVDFLEDAAINILVFIALGWSLQNRALVGMVLAVLLLIPTAAVIWTAWQKFGNPVPPEPWILSMTGLGALVVNIACAFILRRYRNHNDTLTTAAFLSSRKDALTNLAIIVAGIATFFWASGWPDLIVGIIIAALNITAAKTVWHAALSDQVRAASFKRFL